MAVIIPKEEIANAFEKRNPEYEYATSYLAEISSNWHETEKGITRSSFLMVGLSVAFELVFSNKASAAEFLAIKLTNTAIVQISLPVIVAYLYYAVVYSFIESQLFQDINNAILQKIYPALYSAKDGFMLYPPNSIIGSADRASEIIGGRSRAGKLIYASGALKPFIIIFGPPAFLITAYIQLFVRYGLTDVILWISLLISSICLLASSIPIYIAAASSD